MTCDFLLLWGISKEIIFEKAVWKGFNSLIKIHKRMNEEDFNYVPNFDFCSDFLYFKFNVAIFTASNGATGISNFLVNKVIN